MEAKIPLLADQKYVKALRTAEEIRSDRINGKTTKADAKMTRLYTSARKTTDSVVLRKLLHLTNSYYPDRFVEMREGMLSEPLSYQVSVLLTAASLSVDGGDTESAEKLMSNITHPEDLCMFNWVAGKIHQARGDTASAKRDYLRAFASDPYFLPLYESLHSVDPLYGWDSAADLVRMKKGDSPKGDGAIDGRLSELCAIYSGWMKGDRANSMSAILSSDGYSEENPFYLTVYAWMCVSDGRYRKAVRSYSKAIEIFGGNAVFLSEMADLQDRMGDSEGAEEVCRRALESDPYNCPAMGQLIITQIHQGKLRDAVTSMQDLMANPICDARVCVRCMDVFWESDRKSEANSFYKKLVSRCSDPAYSHFMSARYANLNGNHADARRHATAGMKEDPGSIQCICQLALALAGLGRVDEAIEMLRSKRPVFMDDVRLLETEKDILITAERYDSAIELCDSILDGAPRNADVMRDKANAYRLKGDYAQSVACYRECLNIREDMRLFISVLKMLLESRRTDDLCRLTDDYDDTYGNSAIVWRIRGNAEYIAGRYEDAVVSYSRAANIVTNDINIWHSKGMAEEKAGLYANAEASYDRAVILDLENTDCWISKATVQELQGNIRGAIDSLNRVISVKSENVYALAMKGRLLVKLGRLREGRYFLELAYKLEPSNTAILEMILKIRVKEKEYDHAVRLARAVLKREPKNYATMLILADIHIEIGNREMAIAGLNDARPYLSGDRGAAIRCAASYHRLMCYSDEIEIYTMILENDPDDRDVLMLLAEAYSESGMKEKAAETYSKLEAIAPEDMEVSVMKAVTVTEEGPQEETTESAYELARSMLDAGRTEEGMDLLLKSAMSGQEEPEQYLYTASVLSDNGRTEDAMDVMRKASAAFPGDARIMYSIGKLKDSAGDDTGALAAYSDAVRLGMSNHDLFLDMGRRQAALGMMVPAIDSLKAAVKEEPKDREAKVMLSELLIKAGLAQDALPYLNTMIDSDPVDMEVLRLYVTAQDVAGSSEGLLSVYDKMLASERTEEDTEFFRQALIRMGEKEKADALLPEEEEFDQEKAALDVLDAAYEQGKDISAISIYEDLGLSDSQIDKVLDVLTENPDYTPDPNSRIFSELESMSNKVIVGGEMESIELQRVIPLQSIRHLTGCENITLMHRLQRHIEQSFSYRGEEGSYEPSVERILIAIADDTSYTLYRIMKEFNTGIMTARMVLNRMDQ